MKYRYIHDNSNVYYKYEYSLARNYKQNIKLLHRRVNNLKIRAPEQNVRQLLTKHLLWCLRDSDENGGGDGSGM